MNQFLDIAFSPYGGTAVVISGLTTFLAKIWLKRIINRDLSEQRKELQQLKDDNKKDLNEVGNIHQLKLENLKADNLSRLKNIEQNHSRTIENLKLESVNQLEKIRNEFQSEFLKHESYTSIAREQFQSLFDKRIATYTKLIKLKNEIDNMMLERADEIEHRAGDPEIFKECIEKICKLTQENTMYISNELAKLSNNLAKVFWEIASAAKVNSMAAALSTPMGDNQVWKNAVEFAEKDVLKRIFEECSPIYDDWFKQLDKDVGEVREILDISHDFLNEK